MIRCAWCGQDATHRPRIEFWLVSREANVTVCQACANNGEFQYRFPQDYGPVAPAKTASEIRSWRDEQRQRRLHRGQS